MGGHIKQKKSSDSSSSSTRASSSPSLSLFGFLKPRRAARQDGAWDTEAVTSLKQKVWQSDYDRGRYVAEPGIDRKASAFIEKFHATRDSPFARKLGASVDSEDQPSQAHKHVMPKKTDGSSTTR